MMEYKQDRRTGTPLLMEVNGRFWGSLQLAIDAGVDFPYLCAASWPLGRRPRCAGDHTTSASEAAGCSAISIIC